MTTSRRANPRLRPIVNTPYEEPARHWVLDGSGRATDSLRSGRRLSHAILPVPKPAKGQEQPELEFDPSLSNDIVNEIRRHVRDWRDAGQPRTTHSTRQLLRHWRPPERRERQPFFAQLEAVETVIWLTEVVGADAKARGRAQLGAINEESRRHNDGLIRWAVKMATGTGKTVVMGMLIAWHTVNHVNFRRSRGVRNPYTNTFLAITPGHTVRERLAELVPSHKPNVYDVMDLVPARLRALVNSAKVAVVNFQAFQRRSALAGVAGNVVGDAKKILNPDGANPAEDAAVMLDRVLRGLKGSDRLLVLNDEAHHCYNPLPAVGSSTKPSAKAKSDSDSKSGADSNTGAKSPSGPKPKSAPVGTREARRIAGVWFNAVKDIAAENRLLGVYDFSATPMFISTSARSAGADMFPWVVSDFPLMDAIESGLVKIPRLPVNDDAVGDMVKWRSLYEHSKPKKVTRDGDPALLYDALKALYKDYVETQLHWRVANRPTDPVFIVVANSIAHAKALYEYIAGYEYAGPDGRRLYQRGNMPLFDNVKEDGSGWARTPRTLLMHSKLDSDSALKGNLKKLVDQQARLLAANRNYSAATALTAMTLAAKDFLRTVLNTVGHRSEPGEHIRCVVSVAMLTEGWDTRTVTHVLGYRRFGTQLLCEQVTGRALRRTDYENFDDDGRLRPEYADVFGVPFDFMPLGRKAVIQSTAATYRVVTMPGLGDLRIEFPNLAGYRWRAGVTRFTLDPGLVEPYDATHLEAPTKAEVVGTIGESNIAEVGFRRKRAAIWHLASECAKQVQHRPKALDHTSDPKARHHNHDPQEREHPLSGRAQLFADFHRAVKGWLNAPAVKCSNPWVLIRASRINDVVRRVIQSCRQSGQPATLTGVFDADAPAVLHTGEVDFETVLKDRYPNEMTHDGDPEAAKRSEINIAACHSNFEARVARRLDGMEHVEAWTRNYRLGWTIPYLHDGVWHDYEPDFAARVRAMDGSASFLLVECKGIPDEASEAKSKYATQWWVPAVANSPQVPAGLRHWHFTELRFDDHNWLGSLHRAVAAARTVTGGGVRAGAGRAGADRPRRRMPLTEHT